MPSRSTLTAIRSVPCARPVVGAGAVASTRTVSAGTAQSTAPLRVVPVTWPSGATLSTSLEARHASDAGQGDGGCRAAG